MEPLHIPATDTTPEVRLDSQAGQLSIQGVSDEVDAVGFYFPVRQWVETYARQPAESTALDIRLTRFNAASAKALFGIIAQLETLQKAASAFTVNWHYDTNDAELNEHFEQFSDLTSISVNVVSNTEE